RARARCETRRDHQRGTDRPPHCRRGLRPGPRSGSPGIVSALGGRPRVAAAADDAAEAGWIAVRSGRSAAEIRAGTRSGLLHRVWLDADRRAFDASNGGSVETPPRADALLRPLS